MRAVGRYCKFTLFYTVFFVFFVFLSLAQIASSQSIGSCPGGQEDIDSGNGVSCMPCVPGKYKPLTNTDMCKDCQSGRYQPASGQKSCISCPVGHEAPGKLACTICRAGTYNYMADQSQCFLCPSGKYGLVQGATSESVCQFCPAGKWQSMVGMSVCNDCAAGKYASVPASSTDWLINEDRCQFCPAATTSLPGATACVACPSNSNWDLGTSLCPCNAGFTGSACTACVAGKYKTDTGDGTCTECPANSYSVTVASITCTDCPAGHYSPVASISAEACQCNAGYTGSACTACVAGKYKSSTGSSGACAACDAGKFAESAGAAVCISWETCKTPSKLTTMPEAGVCTECSGTEATTEFDRTLLCIETDEHWYTARPDLKNEQARYRAVVAAWRGKLVFVRYKSQAHDTFERLERLRAEVRRHMDRLARGENAAYLEVHHLYYPAGTPDSFEEFCKPAWLTM